MKKLLAGTTLVLPAADMVAGILERMEAFAVEPGRELFAEMLAHKPASDDVVSGINRISIAELVKAMYLDLIQETSEWAKLAGYVNYTEDQWKRMVRGWADNVSQKMENSVFNDVLQDAYDDIHDWVNMFEDNEPNWHVWYVRRLGLDIMVEKGPDYRALDWQRRMNAGVDYIKAETAGEPLPPEAWVPDDDARRFAELLSKQQSKESMLGKSTIDELDYQARRARNRVARPRRPFIKQQGTL